MPQTIPIRIFGVLASQQRSWLFARVAESRRAGRPAVIFVPEQYTLQAERDLMTGLRLPGLLDLDVVSPTRLKALIQERAGSSGRPALDETGRAMALHQALHESAASLEYYKRLGDLYGAVSRMDRTLSELREENLTPEALDQMALSARGAAQQAKYKDLSRIWRAYDALLDGRFDDPAVSWRDLCARLGRSGLWRGANLFIYGFDTLRPDLRSLVLAAAEVCASIQVILTMTEAGAPSGRIFRVQRESARELSAALEAKGYACRVEYLKPEPPENPLRHLEQHLFSEAAAPWPGDPAPFLSLYAAPHPTAEAMNLVSTLREWHAAGIPWNRMAIALPRTAPSEDALTAALRRHGIPFFYSRKQDLARHGVSRLLRSALACVSQGYDTAALGDLAACGFGVLTREEGIHLMEYARAWGIDRNRWRQPFSRGKDAVEMDALRVRMLAPLENLHAALRAAASGQESTEAVFRFLQEEGVYDQLQSRQQRLSESGRYAEAIVDRQVWDLMMDLLDQLHSLLGGRRPSLREMALLLDGALERAALSSLPEEEEGVAIGQIGHMLPGRTEALILPGMNEGAFSARTDSLLTDPERHALESQAGHAIGLDQSRMSMIIRSDYVRTMSLPEKRLHVTWCLRDEGGGALQPGEPVAELRRVFPLLKEAGGLSAEEIPSAPDSPSLALEGLGPLLRQLRSGERADLPPVWQSALRSLLRDDQLGPTARRMLDPFLRAPAPESIPASTALRLFHGERVSISRLECYAACPYQFFLRYGIRPLLPVDFDFTAGDAGNFFHQALQEYTDRATGEPDWPRLSEERVRQLMTEILDRLTRDWQDGPLREDALGRWQGEEYVRRVRHAASVLTRYTANGDFRVLGTEMEFGTPEGLPPLMLYLPDGSRVALQGKIDRLDLYHGQEGDYLRVLDLKSSEKELDPARMDSGEQLQLMIYLRSALRAHPGSLPAGALYFPIRDQEVSSPTPEAAEAQRLKNVQFSGVVLQQEDVVRAMDRDISPYSLPKIYNQDGSVSKSAGWVLTREALNRLMDAAQQRAAELCVEIRSGRIPASPSVDGDRKPCTFCEFQGLCPLRPGDERPLPSGMTYGDVGSGLPNKPLRESEK